MKIKLIWLGKTSEHYLQTGIDMYLQRIKHYCRFELQEIIVPKKWNVLPPDELKKKEGELILQTVQENSRLYLLDEKGKTFFSVGFSQFLEKQQLVSGGELVFVIGGAFGFSEQVYQKAHGKISLSSLTFSHQMIRLFFLEQLYRAHTILKGESYHNE